MLTRIAVSRLPRHASRALIHSSARRHALSKFLMPAMSPTMTEGGIAAWKKKEGEGYAAGDVLLEIETDKATMDVEAQDDGVLGKIIVPDGSKGVAVGTPIAIVGEEGDDLSGAEKLAAEAAAAGTAKAAAPKPDAPKEAAPPPAPVPEAPKPEPAAPAKAETQFSGGPILASPIAKRLALEKGIPLRQIKGSGPGGRIVKADVESYQPPAPAAAPSPTAAPDPAAAAAAKAPAPEGEYIDIPLTTMRTVIGRRLLEAKTTVPHYYLTVAINMDKVLALREVFNAASAAAAAKAGEGAPKPNKLSVNDFIVKACALALAEVPEANSGWMGDFIRQYKKADISVAVATPNGLITPIIKDAGGKGLTTISTETKALAKKARDGKLQPEEYQGGSFTISNLGMYDIQVFSAIINPPQSCILAIGSTTPTLVPAPEEEKGFKTVQIMQATLSSDHRSVDGAVGAKWLAALKRYLENPLTFML
ncbi:pyruvate dehydrogenase [Dacryopinax primogenitus]|uniref:Acetyltransferase component of pyruvate dehydrogenase complex n=1 Tax=Dacryopinax primogenitus (strain DJM 731) TaxID=1858805 RepID=M5G1P7_DACPD|nr:pyruvate dehydrogenase [Dacryopinax primogenitus]EJT99796.1 pyruvate dehydrogenase [Dacryopinax primogenitus]